MKKIALSFLLLSSALLAQNAQDIMNNNGCFGCHAIASKKSAPAFAGIAKRNKRFERSSAKATIIHSIKNGSKGKYRRFSNSQMPPFKHLSKDELSTIADFILQQSSLAKGHGKKKCNR